MMSAVPETMRAAFIEELGAPDRIRIGSLPMPAVGAGSVLVRVHACAVNHVDTFVRSGAYRTEIDFPFVVGRDLVGVVARSGCGFVAGQRVWANSLGHDGRQGACAEYAAVAAGRLYGLPDSVDSAAAVAVLHPGATALLGLRRLSLRAGDTVVVNGSGGAVGSAVVQLASAAGARVIGIDRAEHLSWTVDCGAANVVDRAAADLWARLAAQTPRGIDILWDTTGRLDFTAAAPLLAIGGRVVVIAGMASIASVPIGPIYLRDISIHGFAISNATEAELASVAESLNEHLASGRLAARAVVRVSLAETAAAHRAQESRTYPAARLVVGIASTGTSDRNSDRAGNACCPTTSPNASWAG